jgi:GNAT superfamily N-acetyltransferase
MPLEIRSIADGDVAQVVALWQAAALTVPHNDPYEDIRFCRRTPCAEILLGFDDTGLAATVMVGHEGHRGWYYYVGVNPDRHGAGYGREIMAAAEAWLIERGVGKSQLMIRPTNDKVRAFYERLGYVEEPRLVMSKRFRAAPDWQSGRVETTVIHMEMLQRPERPAAQPPESGRDIALRRIGTPSTRFYRYLYNGIGGDWFWVSRRLMDDDTLARTLNRPGAEYHLLTIDGEPAGLIELERTSDKTETELSYFGLLPGFIGLGLGRYLIDAAVDLAWGHETRRIWVHTCDLDHPRALGNYLAAGFVPFARETEILPDPRDAGLTSPPPADARGHAPDSLFRDTVALAKLPDVSKPSG